MSLFAVMGNPVEHSLSPIIHSLFAKQLGCSLSYNKILIDIACFEKQVINFFLQGGAGLNITLPCKERAFYMADHVTPRCQTAMAANTLWQGEDGLHADNTDGIGLVRDLSHYINVTNKRVLILGAGGAAKGILSPLLEETPRQITVANRTLDKAVALVKSFSEIRRRDLNGQKTVVSCGLSELNSPFDLIINATSASLSNQNLTLPSTIVMPTTVCYDLAYQLGGSTPFVLWAQSRGCFAVDGLGMLVEQAAEAFAIWHGVRPNVEPVKGYLRN